MVAGCGGGGGDSTTSGSAPASAPADGASTKRVKIADFKFDPPQVTVAAGTKLTWANTDSASHTASATDGSFDTGTLDQGDAKDVTLKQPGTYRYVCQFHPFMKGTVKVTG
jgi:plastocyanin